MPVVQYDVCVVGAGPTGSAAARWLSKDPGRKVCLVGPSEPTEEEWNDPTHVTFGSHYDEARIVSEVCSHRRDATWPVVVRRSVSRFRDLERQSGIHFYHEVGCVFKSLKDKVSEIQKSLPPQTSATVTRHSAAELATIFPYLQSDNQTLYSLFEKSNAGYINPRNYILANKTVAERNGCDIIYDVVREVARVENGTSGEHVRLLTKRGRHITSRRVLLCVGGFTNFERLLPDPRKEVDIDVMTEMAIMIEVTKEDALSMSKMPSMLVCVADEMDPKNTYILPPVQYPDGKYYLKVGHDSDLNRPLTSQQEVTSWYRKKGEGLLEDFKSIYMRIHQNVIGFRPKSLHAMTCVTTYTPTGQFYCDMITPSLGLITAGNGGGAMAADEIGRMGARMIAKGAWDSDLPRKEFEVRWRWKDSVTKSHL